MGSRGRKENNLSWEEEVGWLLGSVVSLLGKRRATLHFIDFRKSDTCRNSDSKNCKGGKKEKERKNRTVDYLT